MNLKWRAFLFLAAFAMGLASGFLHAADSVTAKPNSFGQFKPQTVTTPDGLAANGFLPKTGLPPGYGQVNGVPTYMSPPNLSARQPELSTSSSSSQNAILSFVSQLMAAFGQTKTPNTAFYNSQLNVPGTGDPSSPNFNSLAGPAIEVSNSEMNKYVCPSALPAATSLSGHACNSQDTDRMTCMVCALYFEGGNEPREGQLAIAKTIVTRLFNGNFPVSGEPRPTTCKIVYDKKGSVAQYSWTLEKKDHRLSDPSKLAQLLEVSKEAFCSQPGSWTNYWNSKLVSPPWGPACQGKTLIGQQTFCYFSNSRTINRTPEAIMANELASSRGVPDVAPATVGR